MSRRRILSLWFPRLAAERALRHARGGAAGLAGPLVVTESSRVEEVDAHFRRQLRQVFRLGERLAPGVYRVVVGP